MLVADSRVGQRVMLLSRGDVDGISHPVEGLKGLPRSRHSDTDTPDADALSGRKIRGCWSIIAEAPDIESIEAAPDDELLRRLEPEGTSPSEHRYQQAMATMSRWVVPVPRPSQGLRIESVT